MPAPGSGSSGQSPVRFPVSAAPAGSDGATPESVRETIQAGVKAANAKLAQHQRVAGFRIWPEDDLPRTHTLKVKRDVVRRWAAIEE